MAVSEKPVVDCLIYDHKFLQDTARLGSTRPKSGKESMEDAALIPSMQASRDSRHTMSCAIVKGITAASWKADRALYIQHQYRRYRHFDTGPIWQGPVNLFRQALPAVLSAYTYTRYQMDRLTGLPVLFAETN